MTVEHLRVLGVSIEDDDLSEEDLRAAANSAFSTLVARGVDVHGVAPVVNEDDREELEADIETIAEHIVESHTNIDDRLEGLEERMDRAERDIDIIDGGYP